MRWLRRGDVGEDRMDPAVLEAMPIGLMELDLDWVICYVNTAGGRVVGRDPQALIGCSFWEAFPAAGEADSGSVFRQAVVSGEPMSKVTFRTDSGRWLEVGAVGTERGFWVVVSDVTTVRQAQERVALLALVGDDLVSTLDAESAVGRLPQAMVPVLASWATVTLMGADGVLRDVGGCHAQAHRTGLVRAWSAAALHSAPATSPLLRALHTGQTVTLSPQQLSAGALAAVATGPALELLELLAPGSLTVVPLRGRDRVLGAVTLVLDRDRSPSPADTKTTADIAHRAGLALDNTRMLTQQRRLAEELQRSMLTAPPEPDHAQVTVRYLPATEAARVGGDWYDAFLQPDGATTLVIGDVVGHDTAAAASMGQLRSMLRGIATTGDQGPARLLSQLDRAITQLQLDTYATAAMARFEQTPDELTRGVTRMRWANAGHLPLLVIHPDGTLAELSSWHGELMLGVDHRTHRTESVVTLDRGSTVLLFTDGLIETRRRDLDGGMAELRAVAAQLAHLPLDELCDKLLARLIPDGHEDDVALVAIRLHRQDAPRPEEAGPQRVPPTVRAR